MFIIFNNQQLLLRIIKGVLVGCTNGVSVEELYSLMIWKKSGCFHLFLHPEAGLVRGIESSNPQWYMLHFNTITQRLLLLRQQDEIKVFSIGDPSGVSVVRLSDVSPVIIITRDTTLLLANTQTHTDATAQTKSHLCTCKSVAITHVCTVCKCTHACVHTQTKTITSGKNDHKRDSVELELFVLHSSFDVKLQEKGKAE